MAMVRVCVCEVIGGYYTVEQGENETDQETLDRVEQDVEMDGIDTSDDNFKITHREVDLCGITK